MSQRLVQCVKLGKELPGLESPPIPGPVGKRVFENVSAEAWKLFEEHFIMVTNENRLDLMDDSTNDIFFEQIEKFLFEGTAQAPAGYVPIQKDS